jgi:pimeloyl-ACP methyl ester carboxylesterase
VLVRAEDGIGLHAEITDELDAAMTVVFCHGFGGDRSMWGPQREALAGRVRVVAWDHRGHGRSGWGEPGRATIAQTGRDLAAVLAATTATGPVVLVGHSMGGMSIQALAGAHPDLFGTRVVGVLLLATTAGGVFTDGALGVVFGALRRCGLLPVALGAVRSVAPWADRVPWRRRAVGRYAVRHVLFDADDDPAQVRAAQARAEAVPLPVDAAFYAGLLAHDQTAALPALARVPVVVLGGARDRVIPIEHSRRLSAALGPTAELVVVADAGHLLGATHPELVDAALDRLIARVSEGRRTVGSGGRV